MTRRLATAMVCLLAGARMHAASDASFAWFGELVAADQKAVTARAIVEPHVAKYVGQFKPGDRIVLVWQQFDGEGDAVKYVAPERAMAADAGYLVRAEFVSADPASRSLVFKTAVPDSVAKILSTARPGTPIKIRASSEPAPQRTAIVAVALNETPRPRPAPKVEAAATNAVDIAGHWALESSLMGNPVKLACDLTQAGKKLGGTCAGPGPLKSLEVTGGIDGTAVKFQFEITSFGPALTLLYQGELDPQHTAIKGNVNLMGNDSPFTMKRE
jgi:hypothetical protein